MGSVLQLETLGLVDRALRFLMLVVATWILVAHALDVIETRIETDNVVVGTTLEQ